MPDLTPADIAGREFRSGFRGYDPAEVRAFLQDVAGAISAILAERNELAATAAIPTSPDLKDEIASVTREIGTVLEAAREAAESMRERAKVESARWRSEALAEAETERERAAADAIRLRSDAWTTAEQLLGQCQAEALRALERAEKEALRLVGEAEREAHRLQATSRREADELMRTSRMDAERLGADAKTRHDEIIQTALKQSEAAQERTRALEQRRQELMRELELVRSTLSEVEGELDQRRERIGLSAPTGQPPPAAPVPAPWEGETVRVVRPNKPGEPPPEPEITTHPPQPEVRVLSAGELARRRAETGPEHPPEDDLVVIVRPTAEPSRPTPPPAPKPEPPAEPEPVPEPAPEPAPEPSPAPPPLAPSPDPALVPAARAGSEEPAEVLPGTVTAGVHAEGQGALFGDVAGIFARLRTDTVGRPIADLAEPAPTESPGTGASVHRAGPTDPFELRDRLLLPIGNRALRNLKRQLTEEQNAVLEELRLDEQGWLPSAEAIRDRVRADLVVLFAESYGAGHLAAEELLGGRISRPATPRVDLAEEFALGLSEEITEVVGDGRAAGQGARQLGASVSRVFRAWRTDHAERRVREVSLAAYHEGLVRSVELGDGPPLRWIVSGRGCATCRASGEARPEETLPPAHSGCECTLAP